MRNTITFLILVIAGAGLIGYISSRVVHDHDATHAPLRAETAENPLVDLSQQPQTPDELILSTEAGECRETALADALDFAPFEAATWHWAKLDVAAGLTWTESQVVALADDVECEYVPTVVFHEWMHAAGADSSIEGDILGVPTLEVVADCGGSILSEAYGALDYTPYADEAGGCTDELNEMARDIIDGGN